MNGRTLYVCTTFNTPKAELGFPLAGGVSYERPVRDFTQKETKKMRRENGGFRGISNGFITP